MKAVAKKTGMWRGQTAILALWTGAGDVQKEGMIWEGLEDL